MAISPFYSAQTREQFLKDTACFERSQLLADCLHLIRNIALATPLDGEIGDEYDQARKALRALVTKIQG